MTPPAATPFERFIASMNGHAREDAAALISAIAECSAGGPGAPEAFAAALGPIGDRDVIGLLAISAVLANAFNSVVSLWAEATDTDTDELRRVATRGVLGQ